MSILCTNNIKYTDAELDAGLSDNPIIPTVAKPLLSFVPVGTGTNLNPARDANGMLTDTTLSNIITKITTPTVDSIDLKKSIKPIIPIIPKNATVTNKNEFMAAQETLKNNITSEYTFYYCRYIYCLNELFRNIGLTASPAYTRAVNSIKGATDATISSYLKYTIDYNQKLNDLIRIINKLQTTISGNNESTTKDLSGSDVKLDNLIKALEEQNDKLSGKNTVTNLRKDMVKYTEEKGRYTDNLLKMYSVLNIVALGLLVYVYKSAS